MNALLKYTGYPLVDVGAATIAAFSNKRDLATVEAKDLDEMAVFIAECYTREPLKRFIASIFPNAGYVNSNMHDDKRAREIERVLYGYRASIPDHAPPCVFCARPAVEKVFRQHIPLITGDEVMNLGAEGKPGLSVCGTCLLCVQAFPLGSKLRCNRRSLLVHSDVPDLILGFAREFLLENRRILSISNSSEENANYPRTIILNALSSIDDSRHIDDDEVMLSLTAYHLTNYGTAPDITIYRLPSEVLQFVRVARSAKYRTVWNRLVARAWELPRQANRKKVNHTDLTVDAMVQHTEDHQAVSRRNLLYESLFDEPINSRQFIRLHVLRHATSTALDNNLEEVDVRLASWPLTSLFLKEVTGMDRIRIDAIKQVGDRLAALIFDDEDQRLLTDLYGKNKGMLGYRALRSTLVKASTRQIKSGKPVIISFDEIVTIFEYSQDTPRVDWELARDLLYIRVLDWLYERGFFRSHPEAAQEIAEQADDVATDEDGETAQSIEL